MKTIMLTLTILAFVSLTYAQTPTVIPPADYRRYPILPELQEFALDIILPAAVRQNRIPNTPFEVVDTNSISTWTDGDDFYRFDLVLENDAGDVVNTVFTVRYPERTDRKILVSHTLDVELVNQGGAQITAGGGGVQGTTGGGGVQGTAGGGGAQGTAGGGGAQGTAGNRGGAQGTAGGGGAQGTAGGGGAQGTAGNRGGAQGTAGGGGAQGTAGNRGGAQGTAGGGEAQGTAGGGGAQGTAGNRSGGRAPSNYAGASGGDEYDNEVEEDPAEDDYEGEEPSTGYGAGGKPASTNAGAGSKPASTNAGAGSKPTSGSGGNGEVPKTEYNSPLIVELANYGKDSIVRGAIAKNKIPKGVYTVTEIFSVIRTVGERSTDYAFKCEIQNSDGSRTLEAFFTINYIPKTKAKSVHKSGYEILPFKR